MFTLYGVWREFSLRGDIRVYGNDLQFCKVVFVKEFENELSNVQFFV